MLKMLPTRANSQFLQEERERWSATEAKGRSAPKNMRFVQGLAGPRFATLTRQACRPDLGAVEGGGEGFELVKENLRLKFNEPT
jgi:hypothetical protein